MRTVKNEQYVDIYILDNNMENKWLLYEKTIQNIHNNQKIFMNMLIYYYKLVIVDKHNNKEYIKENYPKQNIGDLELFNEYIVETKNLGIFTIFNNIPDVIHPLENEYYTDYGMYISFIKPEYFKKSEKDDVLILYQNIWKYNKYDGQLQYQTIVPYNKYKKYIYVNIKYFNREKYRNYLIIVVNDDKEIYMYDDNIIKKKEKNTWKVVDDIINTKFIYACVLRKIKKEDILNVFNVSVTIKKDTSIYSRQSKKVNNEILTFYTLDKNENLYDPFKIYKYDKNFIVYMYSCKVKKDIDVINLSCDILSNNKLNKIKLSPIDDLLSLDKFDTLTIKEYSNKIYDGNLNYLFNNKSTKFIFYNNMGKRLLNEIIYKTSNFVKLDVYYFDVLHQYSINIFINSYGFYNKLNRYYNYELAFHTFNPELIEIETISELKNL